jgi:hypothetical protein
MDNLIMRVLLPLALILVVPVIILARGKDEDSKMALKILLGVFCFYSASLILVECYKGCIF